MFSLNLIFHCLWHFFFLSALPAVSVETCGFSFAFPELSISVRQSPFLHRHSDWLYGLKMSRKYTFLCECPTTEPKLCYKWQSY